MDKTTTPNEWEEESMHTPNDLFYSPAENEHLLLINKEFDGEFPVGTVYSTRRQLINAMRQKATKFGFFIIDSSMAACCSETKGQQKHRKTATS